MDLRKHRIGLFGGAFNPIHLGHLFLAEQARELLKLDSVQFIPTGCPVFKDSTLLPSTEHRLKMLQLATKGNPNFSVLPVELEKKGKSYTVNLFSLLEPLFPTKTYSYFFIVGMDSFIHFPSWKQPEKIIAQTDLIVGSRLVENHLEPSLRAVFHAVPLVKNKTHFIEIPLLEISSNVIRKKIAQKKSIRYLVPESVQSYIDTYNLYKED
jgi:nicotinate-nucleotide adenylyltransferase